MLKIKNYSLAFWTATVFFNHFYYCGLYHLDYIMWELSAQAWYLTYLWLNPLQNNKTHIDFRMLTNGKAGLVFRKQNVLISRRVLMRADRGRSGIGIMWRVKDGHGEEKINLKRRGEERERRTKGDVCVIVSSSSQHKSRAQWIYVSDGEDRKSRRREGWLNIHMWIQ